MWVALFSQTGSEIYNIAQRTHKAPKYIMTNNIHRVTWHPGLEELGSTIITGKHAMLMDMLMGMRNSPLVTLHGYLRILPEEVVTAHEVINGHPGDIVKYPEFLTIRMYEDNIMSYDINDRVKITDYVNMVRKIIESYGVRCEFEGIAGNGNGRISR